MENWNKIVNEAESTSKEEEQCITNSRPCKSHVWKVLKNEDTSLTKKETYKLIDESVDYKRIVYHNGHVRLGIQGIEDYISHWAEQGMWNKDEMMQRIMDKNILVINKSPEELEKIAIESDKKRRDRNRKKNEGEDKKSRKKPKKKGRKKVTKKETAIENYEETDITRPPKIKKPTEDTIETVKASRKVMKKKPISTQVPKKMITSIDEVESRKEKILKVKEETMQKNEVEIPQELQKEDLDDIVQSMLKEIKMDKDYVHLLTVLMKVKTENKGKPLKEEQILAEATKIDSEFPKKFFKRVFRITPFCEILRIRPTGFIM